MDPQHCYLGTTCTNPCKKVLVLKSKKVIVNLFEAGAGAVIERNICGSAEPEQKEIFSAPQHWTVHTGGGGRGGAEKTRFPKKSVRKVDVAGLAIILSSHGQSCGYTQINIGKSF